MRRANSAVGNSEALAAVAPLVLSGFPEWKPYGGLSFHMPGADPVQDQYDRFRQRVLSAIGREYFPVYRMADGEFSLLVGWRAPRGQRPGIARRAVWAMRELSSLLGRRSISTCWGERYSGKMVRIARDRMAAGVKLVASNGVIAAYFARRGDRWGEQYIDPMWRWLDEQGVQLGAANYIPFYCVYALLSGPGKEDVWKGRRVLVATSLAQPGRRDAIVSGLLREGVASVGFVEVSAGASMFDEIELPREKFDIAVVAAGIGSVNVLRQLEPLKIPAIDCGIVLECLMNPARRRERPFLLSEEHR